MLPDKYAVLGHHILPKKSLTKFAGFMANLKIPFIKQYLISGFIRDYAVNMSEALNPDPTSYACFNDFFIRRLNPVYRPIATQAFVSPVDGCLSEMGDIAKGSVLQAKGRDYSLAELLGGEGFIDDKGCFATFYLSPKDYHRVHMPIEGTCVAMRYIPGKLFSVQPKTVLHIPRLFARNERAVMLFDTPLGRMAMVMVGATIVGSIGVSWCGEMKRSEGVWEKGYQDNPLKPLQKGDEVGYFKLGSTVVLIFENPEAFSWLPNVHAGMSVRFGEGLGEVC